MTITYEYYDSLYVNITNRCTNNCDFCVRNKKTGVNGQDELWLEREPTLTEIKEDFNKRDLSEYKEIVFCGYGEPLMRYNEVLKICEWLKGKNQNLKIRINTNGHGNMIAGNDITPQMKDIVDVVSISLNAKTAREYEAICHSVYGEKAYTGLLEFAHLAKQYVPQVILTVVDILDKQDIDKCRAVADKYGVEFRIRSLIE